MWFRRLMATLLFTREQGGHRVTVTCPSCGHRNTLERKFSQPEPIRLICHECEAPLLSTLPAEPFAAVPW